MRKEALEDLEIRKGLEYPNPDVEPGYQYLMRIPDLVMDGDIIQYEGV